MTTETARITRQGMEFGGDAETITAYSFDTHEGFEDAFARRASVPRCPRSGRARGTSSRDSCTAATTTS
jgi:hypothetical protein